MLAPFCLPCSKLADFLCNFNKLGVPSLRIVAGGRAETLRVLVPVSTACVVCACCGSGCVLPVCSTGVCTVAVLI